MATNVEKRLAFETLLGMGKTAVFLNQFAPGVVLPGRVAGEPGQYKAMMLNFSHKFHMPGFKVTDECIEAGLSFGGKLGKVVIPWEAVVGFVQDGKMMETYEEDIPPNPANLKPANHNPGLPMELPPPMTGKTKLGHFGIDTYNDPDMAKWFTGTIAEG